MNSLAFRKPSSAGFLFVLMVLILIPLSSPVADDEEEGLGTVARIETESAHDEALSPSATKSKTLGWLEEILTRIPGSTSQETDRTAVTDTGKDARKLELSAVQPRRKPSKNEDGHPLFPKPPNIPPLYTSPPLEGEGIWTTEDLPRSIDDKPLIYKTVYRPSVEFPNSVVYMSLFDMKRIKVRLFIGNSEPGVYLLSSYTWPQEDLSNIVAITNAMWMQQHARGAGAIFRGQIIYPMVPGMATMVIYEDNSVDILEWSNDIPLRLVKDARQLRYLIVKDGMVVDKVAQEGQIADSEIGLGGLLIDNKGQSTMRNRAWFLANRTAFGIKEDGNLIFAMGHHIGTRDLAKALVLAGCKRAIHGDANIHNIVCNFYFRNGRDKIVKRDRLSPEQLSYTMKRYDQGYTKDFFAFYEK